ncbi:MAG: hypothetical protein M1455_10190 [Actinobacteria bacterium]|nr:hypothetical protein [Actinomycetota bacterium]
MQLFELAVSYQDLLEEGLVHQPTVVVLGFHICLVAVSGQFDCKLQQFLNVIMPAVYGF